MYQILKLETGFLHRKFNIITQKNKNTIFFAKISASLQISQFS